jgi:hypothetical protein
MPFLFVDYDQGAGGEYFCANLSRSQQCNKLNSISFSNGRTKVIDVFHQEFLKNTPMPKYVSSHPTLYDVVPSHRSLQLATELLGKIFSIRIANPSDDQYWKYLKTQQIKKTQLSPPPSGAHFIGELEMLSRSTDNKDWIKKVKQGMDGASIILISKGIEPTEENKQKWLNDLTSTRQDEPLFNYDLIIPYEDLFINTNRIKQQIKEVFNIDILDNWLEKYKLDYDNYTTS